MPRVQNPFAIITAEPKLTNCAAIVVYVRKSFYTAYDVPVGLDLYKL